jgi:hypothetical protein
MKTKLTLFVTVLAAALFGMGCASSSLNKGLVAYYPFNGNANDESGKGHDGMAIGNMPLLTPDRHGMSNKAYKFNSNTAIRLPVMSKNFSGDYSISTWVTVESFDSPYPSIILGQGTKNFLNLQLRKSKQSVIFYTQIDNGNIGRYLESSSNTITVGNPHHIVVSKKGEEASLYIDDVLIQKTSPIKTHLLGDHLSVGYTNRGAPSGPTPPLNEYNGRIDDIRIYNRALSAEEVKALYDLEKPKGK